MNSLSCPLCHEEVYSGVGFGCMMCGMPLKEFEVDFCCDECEESYNEVNHKHFLIPRTN